MNFIVPGQNGSKSKSIFKSWHVAAGLKRKQFSGATTGTLASEIRRRQIPAADFTGRLYREKKAVILCSIPVALVLKCFDYQNEDEAELQTRSTFVSTARREGFTTVKQFGCAVAQPLALGGGKLVHQGTMLFHCQRAGGFLFNDFFTALT